MIGDESAMVSYSTQPLPADDDDSRSTTYSDINELESYLYSQIHYNQCENDDELPLSKADKNSAKCTDVIVLSDSESPVPRKSDLSDTAKKNARFVDHYSSSGSSADSDDEVGLELRSTESEIDQPTSTRLQFNIGASTILATQHFGAYHPLMSVRQQQSRNFSVRPKSRYFQQEKDSRNFGTVASLFTTYEANPDAEFHCYICGETTHLAKACHLKLNDRPRRGLPYLNFTTPDDEVCTTCGRKNHPPKAWLVRGPPRLVCPNLRCTSCGDSGHKLIDCRNYDSMRGRTCRRCGIPGHLQITCPDMWRMFHATVEQTSDEVSVSTPITINERRFCFVCGRRGHFGFECQWDQRPTTARFLKSPFISTFHISREEQDQQLQDSAILIDDESDNEEKQQNNSFWGKIDEKHEDSSTNSCKLWN